MRSEDCCGIDTHNPCVDCPNLLPHPAEECASRGCFKDATVAVPDTRADVEAFLLYVQGYQDALDVFSSMLEEVIGE